MLLNTGLSSKGFWKVKVYMGTVAFYFNIFKVKNIFVLYIVIGNIRQRIIREIVSKNFNSFQGY